MADFTPILPGVLGAAAAAIALPLILWTVRPNAEIVGDKRVLVYTRPVKLFVAVFWLGCLGLSIAAMYAPETERALFALLAFGFFAMALAWHLECFGVRIVFDKAGITTHSPWRPGRRVLWASVLRVRFSPAAQWYVIDTQGHGRVRLHVYLSGIESLLTELERRGVPVARRSHT